MTRQTEYNRERKAQSDAIKREFKYEKALAELYQEGSKRIQNRIDGFYLRYAGREGLTIAEAKKRASDTDVEKLARTAKEAVRIKDFSPYTNEVLRRYNLKMQVSRLQLMQAQLEMDLQNLLSDSYDLMDKARMDEMLGELKRQAGILGNSAISPSRKYKGILNADFYGATFSERVWGAEGLHGNLKRELFGSLGRIYTDMMGYKEERKRLAKQFGTSLSNANRLLKTEMSRIRTQTDHEYLKDNGFTHLIYVAEAGACPVCDALDGQAIPIHDGTMGSNLPPMHPNCRCSFYGHIKLDRKDGTSTLDGYEIWGNKLTKEGQQEYNESMKTSGAIFGAWNDNNDPYYKERDRHAKSYYDEVRNRDKEIEVSRVAQNTNFTLEEISKIYDHIFINEHDLEGGRRRFDANYDMAESWRRLSETGGKTIQDHDIIMLNHELMESELMKSGLSYVEAHLETDKKYNYQKAWIKWATEKGDL